MPRDREFTEGEPAGAGDGWYVDPWRLAPARWWEGTRWTGATAGWKGAPLLPPLSEDGRCRVAVYPGSEGSPTPAELWRRWEPAARPCIRWWHPQNAVRLALAALVVLTVPTGPPVLLVFLGVLPLAFWQQAWRDARRPLALVRPGLQGASGRACPRSASSSSGVTSTECVWWETRLDRRSSRWPRRWRPCWRLTAPECDLAVADVDGSLWVHVGRPRHLRPAMVELVREEFDHDGHRYRLVERGLPVGARVQVTGPIRRSSLGEPIQSDVAEQGWQRSAGASPWFNSSAFSLLPEAAVARRRGENANALAATTLGIVSVVLGAVVWSGVWGDPRDGSGWTDAIAESGFLAVLLGVPVVLSWMMESERAALALADDVVQAFWLVQHRLTECEAMLANASGAIERDTGAGGSAEQPTARPEPPSPADVERTAAALVALDSAWKRLAVPDDDTPLVVARRRLELAVGYYRRAVAEAEPVRSRRGYRARQLARRLPEVPPALPALPEWA